MSEQISIERFRTWLLAYAKCIRNREDYLTQLDAAIGDADHGINMQRGMDKVREQLAGQTAPLTVPTWGTRRLGHADSPTSGTTSVQSSVQTSVQSSPVESKEDIASFLRSVGMLLVNHVGGASGPLYGSFFLSAAKEADRWGESFTTVTLPQLTLLFRSGVEGVQQRGKAQLGDKTMLDAMLPAVEALEQAARADESAAVALQQAERAAQRGLEQSVSLQARRGRASYLGPRSIGHQDPGATSTYYLFETAAATLGRC